MNTGRFYSAQHFNICCVKQTNKQTNKQTKRNNTPVMWGKNSIQSFRSTYILILDTSVGV